MDNWPNGYFGKNDDLPVSSHHSKHHPPKMVVLPKTFLKSILAAKCQMVRAPFKYVTQTAATTFAFSSV